MKIPKFAAVFFAVFMLLNACGGEAPEKDPNEVVQEGLANLSEVDSTGYELSIGAEANTTDSSLGFTELNFDIAFAGDYDSSTEGEPQFSMKIDGSGTMDDEEEEAIDAELRFTGGTFYFLLSNFTSFQGQIPVEFVEPFFGKWLVFPLPPEYKDLLATYGADEESMSPEKKELKDLLKNTKFFKDVKYKGTEKVGGAESYHYEVNFDEEALIEYTSETNRITLGGELSESEKEDIRKTWESIDFGGEVWVGVDDMIMRQFVGEMVIDNLDKVSMDLDVRFTVSNVNKDVDVEAPEDALDIMSVFGGAGF